MGLTSKDANAESPAAEKPWLARADWAAGRITSSSRGAVFLIWVFAAFWTAVSIFIVLSVVPREWHRGNHIVLLVLLFPIVGVAMLIYALKVTRVWRRYGQSVFEMAAVPGAAGGTLEGLIELSTRLRPEHGLHLRLSCIRRSTTGTGKDRTTTEKILWQDEKWLRPDLPEPEGRTGIPVYFKLPASQPESTLGKGDGIYWQLEASAKVPGPNFHASFEVPVFKVPETPVPADDPTAPYQMSVDEMRQQIHSCVRINDLPEGGKEFVFPPARNRGLATGASVFLFIWIAVVALMVWGRAPLLLPCVFGVIGLLMAIFTFDLWFRRGRVVATPAQVQIEKAWLNFKKQRTLKISEVANIAATVGATAGHAVYYDLKIRTRDRHEFTAAKNLASKPEADWLVRQMVTAVKNSP
jgi:hypothetical protein